MSTIEIDGKKYEVLGTETKGDSFGIRTNDGTKSGTFWMKPCEPKPGQAAFYMGVNGFVVTLPPECPQRISRITFDEPDLTDQFPEEVKADYLAYKKHCEKTGEKMLSLEQYKACVAVSDVWKRHKTPELVLQYGYFSDDFLIYYGKLEGQKIDSTCLHKFKWAAEYMDEDGRGTFIFFERLAGPDPLPKGYKKTGKKAKGGRKPAVEDATERTAIVKEFNRRIATGQKPTTAAKGVESWVLERYALAVGWKTIYGYVTKARNVEKKK